MKKENETVAQPQTIDTPEIEKPAGARVPWWMYVVILVAAAPGLSFPWVLKMIDSPMPVVRGLAWFYPAYVVCSAVLAWMCYGRRTLMCWIILVLLALSHLCFFYLAYYTY